MHNNSDKGCRVISVPSRQHIVQVLRRIHRWLGIVLALFIAVIALTGTILQVIMVIYGDTGPRQAPDEPFWVVRLRDWAVTVHTGAFTGISGVYVGMICAMGLLFFAVSGVWMNLALHRSRAAQGHKSLFWWTRTGNGAAMRSLHRWITLPFALFALLLSLTGGSLDLYFARYDMVPLPPPRLGGTGSTPKLEGPAGPPNGGRVWHELSLSLHKLNFLGWAGHALGVILGLALMALVVSGTWIFASLYGRRRKAGLTGLFW
jgi:uncharacterized iron-regulated membrane protein